MTSYIWSSVVAGFEGVAKDRAPGLPLGKMGWAEITPAYDFIPLARDGQWTSFGLVPKGVDPVYLEVPGIGKVLHAPTIKVNIGPKGEPLFFIVVPDVFARGAHAYNFGNDFFDPEPILAVPLPTGLDYRKDDGTSVDVTGCFITGVILKETPGPAGKVTVRTNLQKFRAAQLQDDGSVILESKKFWLYGLFAKDDNRLAPGKWDAYFCEDMSHVEGWTKPKFVLVRELAQAM